MPVNPTLYCPIRGQLKVKTKTPDGLTFTEEKRRIDSIKYLLERDYPPDHLQIESTLIRFGNAGRNSFRTDIVVFEKPTHKLKGLDLEERRNHIFLIGEVKRDHKEAEIAKRTQVKAAMGFLPDLRSVGLYWDDIEQKVFYKQIKGNKQRILEAPLTYLPDYGGSVNVKRLRYENLQTSSSLVGLFKNIEDTLHSYIADVSIRYELLLQILLVKIFDESAHKNIKNGGMILQDFSLFDAISDEEILNIFNDTLSQSLNIYQRYLPKPVIDKFNIDGAALREVSKHIAPVKLLESSPEVMQEFYMYFAKQLYKWDLAQYFTPYEVVDFIVRITNPQFGDTIKDPACGSADFLISAHRRGVEQDPKIGERVFGTDNSVNAVQISVLNMLLNGDGKSNIKQEDSLFAVNKYENQFSLMLCNPPFGVKITEKRPQVLANFDLGKNYTAQQTGILFTELVVRQAKPGGRIALIVPNGYLGNKSENYRALRKWILRHTRVACIIGFPRFTFKKSGADVSASVLILEKRKRPLNDPLNTEEYPVYVNLLESVGWNIGNKKAEPIYKRNRNDGAILLDLNNDPILDADFSDVLNDLYRSPVIYAFRWLSKGIKKAGVVDGWSVSINHISAHKDFLLDPKRLCRKYLEVIEGISSREHYSLLDICEVQSEGWKGRKASNLYRYVELSNVNGMAYEYQELHGWQLPSRAKHKLEKRDILIGSVWGSVGKWFVAGPEADDGKLIATNGFYRLKVKAGKEHLLPDLVFALSSEFYRVQMRALATGSDGLAEIPVEDLRLILIPALKDKRVKADVEKHIQRLGEESVFFRASMATAIKGLFSDLDIPARKSNFSQV
jgi:type I restriction enzyme M protein